MLGGHFIPMLFYTISEVGKVEIDQKIPRETSPRAPYRVPLAAYLNIAFRGLWFVSGFLVTAQALSKPYSKLNDRKPTAPSVVPRYDVYCGYMI